MCSVGSMLIEYFVVSVLNCLFSFVHIQHDGDLSLCSDVFRLVKAENVMFASDGHVKLVDFGLAKESVSTADGAHSMVGR